MYIMIEILVAVFIFVVGIFVVGTLIWEDIQKDEQYWKKHGWNYDKDDKISCYDICIFLKQDFYTEHSLIKELNYDKWT